MGWSDNDEYGWSLEVDCFPNCCGVDVICGFPEQIENLNKITIKDIEKEIRSIIKRSNKRGILQITLNSLQNRQLGKLVKEFGFKVKHSFYNPNTSNRVYLYTLVINQPKKVVKKVKKKFGR